MENGLVGLQKNFIIFLWKLFLAKKVKIKIFYIENFISINFLFIDPEAKTSHMLMALVIPGHLVFFFLIYVLSDARVKPTLTIWLVLFYLLAAFLQVI